MEVSVIVPIWNSIMYLPSCINGLKSQTFKNFEVIFVIDSRTNDGSDQFLKSIDNLDFKIIIQHDDGCVG